MSLSFTLPCVIILTVFCSGLGSVLLCLLSLSVMVLFCRLRRFKMAALEKDGISASDPPSIFDHTGFMTHKGRINWVIRSEIFKYSSPGCHFEAYAAGVWQHVVYIWLWNVRCWCLTAGCAHLASKWQQVVHICAHLASKWQQVVHFCAHLTSKWQHASTFRWTDYWIMPHQVFCHLPTYLITGLV